MGLIRAIEIYDPSRKVAFATPALLWIATAINREIRRRRHLVSLDSIYGKGAKKVSSTQIAPVDSEAFVDHLSFLLKSRGLVGNHHIVVWALHDVFGHLQTEIARSLNVSHSAVNYMVRKTRSVLKKHEER